MSKTAITPEPKPKHGKLYRITNAFVPLSETTSMFATLRSQLQRIRSLIFGVKPQSDATDDAPVTPIKLTTAEVAKELKWARAMWWLGVFCIVMSGYYFTVSISTPLFFFSINAFASSLLFFTFGVTRVLMSAYDSRRVLGQIYSKTEFFSRPRLWHPFVQSQP